MTGTHETQASGGIEVVILRVGDNYTYLFCYGQDRCFIVDPGQAEPVTRAMDKQALVPTHLLLTHHHQDHTGGAADLVRRAGCTVIEPGRVQDSDRIIVEGVTIQIVRTPGHTRDSVCYYLTEPPAAAGWLFTGDTLFIAGCGRVLETDMDTMYQSLCVLAALPEDTLVYPGHDYTEENCRFALMIEPDNPHVRQALRVIGRLRSPAPHVPSTIRKEKRTNPFLRAPDAATFAARRRAKDRF